MRAYAVGDIHGQRARLEVAHALIAADRAATGDAAAPVVHLGDLVDRGPDSAGVIDLLLGGIAAGAPWVVLKGNHDRMFHAYLDDPFGAAGAFAPAHRWLNPGIGGVATLASYGLHAPGDRPVRPVHAEAVAAVPAAHRAFLAGLPLWHRLGEVLFVHAGIRPGVPLARQHEDDLLWIRDEFLADGRDHGPLVVHGHTAVAVPEHHGNRVNIDTRAGYGGPVTAVAVEGREVFVLGRGGRRRLAAPQFR
ncbi:MAG: metallophosphoesterase [Rhodobacteraceae bacterium]|jgi:serine/threonine protein phosphatase 1|nr:metallophosphoesterase [Paracoccaceae bacterium]